MQRPGIFKGQRAAAWSRFGLSCLLLSALLLAAGWTSRAKEPADKPADKPAKPNILLVVVDTLRADRLGAYGFERDTSPNIDKLASRGVRFERYHTVAPSTLASFTSLLTGRHPRTHGVYRNGVAWPEGLAGMQRELYAAGFQTAAFVASYCLTTPFGIDAGFEHFDDQLTQQTDLRQNHVIRDGDEVTDAVLGWLGARKQDPRPFFAMVHYFDPHWPYDPPERLVEMFDPDYRGEATGSIADLREAREKLRRSGKPGVLSRHLHARHLGEIRFMDEQFGRLMAGLREHGIDENTVVVLTADHGETFWEHEDYFDHGNSVYESNVRIPLIVAGPGIASGRVVPESYSSIDLAPTLLGYAAIDVPAPFEGESFLSRLAAGTSKPLPPRTIFAEATKSRHRGAVDKSWPSQKHARCVIRDGRKLIIKPYRSGQRELYDLSRDPDEQRDLWTPEAAADPLAAGLVRDLEAWSRRRPKTLGTEPSDDELEEKLRSLGYVN